MARVIYRTMHNSHMHAGVGNKGKGTIAIPVVNKILKEDNLTRAKDVLSCVQDC